jgi:dynein light chain LC8-type
MEKAMQESAVSSIKEAFENIKEEKFIANKVRDDFDKLYGPSWNVVVGKNFGSHVVHQTKSYLFATYGDDQISILLWKSG